MKKIEWYAFCNVSYSGLVTNPGKLQYVNVIRQDLIDRVKKLIRKNADYEEIKKEIDASLMCDYWSKSEYEVIVSNWTGPKFEQKIDIYYQLQPNIDRITEYLIKEIAPRKYKDILNKRK